MILYSWPSFFCPRLLAGAEDGEVRPILSVVLLCSPIPSFMETLGLVPERTLPWYLEDMASVALNPPPSLQAQVLTRWVVV
jgi:hypothetical protein